MDILSYFSSSLLEHVLSPHPNERTNERIFSGALYDESHHFVFLLVRQRDRVGPLVILLSPAENSTCARMKSSQVTPPCAIRAIFHELLKPAESPRTLIMAPTRNSIRYIENDPEQRREKYDGSRWRLACTWNRTECTNLAYAYQLCSKHNDIRRNKLPRPKVKPTPYPLPMAIDDDIQIIREYNCVRISCRSSPLVSSGLFPIASRNRG